jgi:hypothetical protein
VRGVLGALYSSYREREPLTAKVLRDRAVVPALDSLLKRTIDVQMKQLAETLGGGCSVRGKGRKRVLGLLALALDFATWRKLSQAGLSDQEAAELMTRVASGVAG